MLEAGDCLKASVHLLYLFVDASGVVYHQLALLGTGLHAFRKVMKMGGPEPTEYL